MRLRVLTMGFGLAVAACGSEGVADDKPVEVEESGSRTPPRPEPAGSSFTLTPTNPQAGETFEARFAPGNSRGGYFLLSLWNDETWNEPVFLLESDANDRSPSVVIISDDSGVDDYGVEGPGPDGLVMPSEINEGIWRLCTENAVDDVCTQIVVGSTAANVSDSEDPVNGPEEPATSGSQSVEGAGVLCEPGPDSSVVGDDKVAPDRRGEALVKYLTGIDELILQEEEEGVDIVYDDPNYGGVWGDFAGGWVVAVLDCSEVDLDRIAAIAGGARSVRIIQVPYTFEEINEFRDHLVSELRGLGVAGDVLIDSTLTGRHIRLVVPNLDRLGEGFGSEVPSEIVTIQEGQISEQN